MTSSNSRPDEPTAPAARGGCPVDHSSSTPTTTTTTSSLLFSWPWATGTTTPTPTTASRPAANAATIVPDQQPPALTYQPASIEEAAQHAQTPQPDQRIQLGTNRQVSSIPRGADSLNGPSINTDEDATKPSSSCPVSQTSSSTTKTPHHQHDASESHWVYPSEQQLYNAMRRKGWTNVPEDSISTVLNIHNTINERTWKHIQEYENSQELTLVRFQGRPTEPSPKAWLLCHFLKLYDPPFDRHDWYVQHNTATERASSAPAATATTTNPILQRYVIDYYYTHDPHTQLPRPYIDARPALDHPRAVLLRGQQFFKDAFPAISKRFFADHVGGSDRNDGSRLTPTRQDASN